MIGCAPHYEFHTFPFIGHHWGGPLGGLLGLAAFGFWVWALVDVLTKETDDNNQRLIWGLVVGFTYVVGAIIYVAVRRSERLKTLGR
jgi:hypothetical protein